MENEKNNEKKNQHDLERIRQILRDIAEKLSKANSSLKRSNPDISKEHSKKAEEAAEKLRRALNELKKRRKEVNLQKPESKPTPSDAQTGCESTKAAQKSDGSIREEGLPVYKGDFASANEYERLTNLPPITRDEIENTNWDGLWKFID